MLGLTSNRTLGMRSPDLIPLAVVQLAKWGLWVWLFGDKKML